MAEKVHEQRGLVSRCRLYGSSERGLDAAASRCIVDEQILPTSQGWPTSTKLRIRHGTVKIAGHRLDKIEPTETVITGTDH
jgi:hypothetical protein